MTIVDLLKETVAAKASDLHITVGIPPIMRINGSLNPFGDISLTPQDTYAYVCQILKEPQLEALEKYGEVDLSYFLSGIARFRVNAYKQRGSYALAIRVVSINPPTLDELGFPSSMKNLAMKQRGLILVTGPTGSGKSTTLAAMVDYINNNRNFKISIGILK